MDFAVLGERQSIAQEGVRAINARISWLENGSLEKVQGATRLGATGLRASERKSASERVSERTSENLSKISETSEKSLKTSENLSKSLKTLPLRGPLRDPLRGRFPLRGSQSCCPYSVAPWALSKLKCCKNQCSRSRAVNGRA